MDARITPAQRVGGTIRLPGDKSISHRYALLAGIAEGTSRIRNYSTGADCASTLGGLRDLGIPVEHSGSDVTIEGRGLDGLGEPSRTLDSGNSGSMIRMLAGILAAQPFPTTITGDESVCRRPMARVIKPLEEMGASIAARDGRFPPLEFRPAPLHPIEYTLPVASAQVKSCVLLAGLFTEGTTVVREPMRTRDHTEIALREFGAEIDVRGREISLRGRPRLAGRELNVPGDLSSAAFFLVAASMIPGSELRIENVGLNPTRSALLDFLVSIGADVRVSNLSMHGGEPAGDVAVRAARIRGGIIEKEMTAALIDEIPVLAVLGAASEQGLIVRDAAELRVKETDRIATVVDNLARLGVRAEARPDGLSVPGGQKFRAARFDSFGDHRIAMAFAVAALAADGECTIDNAAAAAVSFPEFFDILSGIAQ